MILELTIAGMSLDLPADVRIRLVRTSPFFRDQLTGEYSFTFALPVTPNNASILSHTHLPNSGGDRRRDYECTLQAGPFSLLGILQVRETSRTQYQANLIVPPGNIPAKTWNRKINSFDLGSVTFPSRQKSTWCWTADVTAMNIVDIYRMFLQDQAGNTISTFFYSPVFGWNTLGWSNQELLEDFSRRLMEADDNFIGYVKDNQFVIQAAPSKKLGKLVIQYAGNTPRPNQEFTFTEVFYRDWSAYQLDTLGSTNLLLTDDRFKFVTIQNEEWYDSEQAKGFAGYVNYYASLFYPFNDQMYPTRYSLSPHLNLKWVLETIFQQLGFRLESNFFNEYANLHLYNNRSLDEQVPGLLYPFNQFKDTIVFADHLPDLSLREFIEGLGVLFFHRWILDPVGKVARFVPLDTVALLDPKADLTDLMVKEYTIQATELTEHQFRFSLEGSDALAKDSTSDEASDQEKESYQIFKPFPEKESELAEKNERHETPFSPLFQEQAYIPSIPATVYGVLKAKQRGISPLFKQEETAIALPRLFFYTGLALVADVKKSIENTTIDAVMRPAGRLEQGDLRLTWEFIVAKYGKNWLSLLNGSFDLKRGMALSASDLATLFFTDKQHLEGLNYLPYEIDVELGKLGVKGNAIVTWKKA